MLASLPKNELFLAPRESEMLLAALLATEDGARYGRGEVDRHFAAGQVELRTQELSKRLVVQQQDVLHHAAVLLQVAYVDVQHTEQEPRIVAANAVTDLGRARASVLEASAVISRTSGPANTTAEFWPLLNSYSLLDRILATNRR